MFFAMQCARSVFVIAIAWFALRLTGQIRAVGWVLIFWQFFGLVVGPFMGAVVDRHKRQVLLALGEGISATGVTGLALYAFLLSPEATPLAMLCVVACIVSVGSLLSMPALQALLQISGGPALTRSVAFGALFAQLGNIAGAAVAGISIAKLGIASTLGLCAAFSSIVAIVSLFAIDEGRRRHAPVAQTGLISVIEGFQVIRRSRAICTCCVTAIFSFSVCHITNVFLGAFTLSELALDAISYGWVAAAISCGGLAGTMLLAAFPGSGAERLVLSYGLLILALAVGGFASASTLWQAMTWSALIGLAFVVVRAVCDARLLKSVPNEMIGRINSNILSGIGAIGVLIYLSPNLLTIGSVRYAYVAYAAVLAIVWLASILWERASSKPTR